MKKDKAEIKENKKVTVKKKKSNTSIGTKIFIWFMFIAMLLSFVAPLLYYLIATK